MVLPWVLVSYCKGVGFGVIELFWRPGNTLNQSSQSITSINVLMHALRNPKPSCRSLTCILNPPSTFHMHAEVGISCNDTV